LAGDCGRDKCAKMTAAVPALDELPPWLLYTFGIPFGLAWGSFLNVVIYRLPRGENLAFPGSKCPGCGAPIRARHNVPLVSYLWLRGRAACCGAPISPRYPLVELIGGLLAFAILRIIVGGLPGETSFAEAFAVFGLHLALGLGLVALALIDLEYMILPDSLTLGGAAVGLASAGFRGVGYLDSLIGAVVGFVMIWLPFDLLYSKLRGHPGMGLGDAKLTALAGAWFGWQGAVFALFAGAIQATLSTLAVFAVRGRIDEPEAVLRERAEAEAALRAAAPAERAELEREMARDPLFATAEGGFGKIRIPFGPFLALSILEYSLFGRLALESLLPWLTEV
jgi:leader peptidase (prepilin peptidase)/N-methyltransferase